MADTWEFNESHHQDRVEVTFKPPLTTHEASRLTLETHRFGRIGSFFARHFSDSRIPGNVTNYPDAAHGYSPYETHASWPIEQMHIPGRSIDGSEFHTPSTYDEIVADEHLPILNRQQVARHIAHTLPERTQKKPPQQMQTNA